MVILILKDSVEIELCSEIHLIYDNTTVSYPLRRWIIDLWAQDGVLDEAFTPEKMEKDPEKNPLDGPYCADIQT